MIKERMMIFIKKQLKNFYEETVNEDSLDYVAEIMDHYSEDIADGILNDKANFAYDLLVECLKEYPEDEPRNGFYQSVDATIECEYEYQAIGVADLLSDCYGGERWNISYDENRMMWDIYPDVN